MFTTQNPDPDSKKPFILWRLLIIWWQWLIPPTQAHKDRQPRKARLIAAGLLVLVVSVFISLFFLYGRDAAKIYKTWRSSMLAREATKLENQATDYLVQNRPMDYQDTLVKAFNKVSEAYISDSSNPEAVRVAARIYTRAGQSQARYLWDRLQSLNAINSDDVPWRIQALARLNEDKSASDQIEEVLRQSKPTKKIVNVADEVMQRLGRSNQLLVILKGYTEREPDDLETRFTYAMRLFQLGNSDQKNEGWGMLWKLAGNNDIIGLRAIEFLDSQQIADPNEQIRLIERLEGHPLSGENHMIAALRRRVLAEPDRKQELMQNAINERGEAKREQLVPLAQWIIDEMQPETLLDFLKEDQVRDYQPLLHLYLNALTIMKRYDDLERIVKDPRTRLTTAERDFHLLHLAFVKTGSIEKPDDGIDKLLVDSVSSALKENRLDLLLDLGLYAEKRKHYRTAMQAFTAASVNAQTEREGYEGMLRTSYLAGSSKEFASAARETARRWPDNQEFLERYFYSCLLNGTEIEAVAERCSKLYEARPNDSQRKLLMSLASYRMLDREACVRYMQGMLLSDLSPGQGAVFCGLLRSIGYIKQAGELASAIPDDQLMLPEENEFLRFAKG
jgi:hypothetical protein